MNKMQMQMNEKEHPNGKTNKYILATRLEKPEEIY